MVLPPDLVSHSIPYSKWQMSHLSHWTVHPLVKGFISSIFVGPSALYIGTQQVFFLTKIASLPMETIWKCLQMLYNWIKVILLPYYYDDYVYEIYHKQNMC